MFIRNLLLPLICYFSLCSAEIKEIMSMEELCDPIAEVISLDKIPLIVFDIDDTLATTEQEFGSSAWFYRELETQQSQPNVDKQKVLKEVVAFYTHVHNYLPLKAVEPETPLFVTYLQSIGIPCIALTARSLLIDRTFEQLLPLGIDFTLCIPSDDDILLSNNPVMPARYTRGIIFNGDNNKGTTLLNYLNTIGYTPDHVIYIDDNLKQVQRVHEALQAAGIPCSAFRYGFMDEYNENLDSVKANQQLNDFLKIHPFELAA